MVKKYRGVGRSPQHLRTGSRWAGFPLTLCLLGFCTGCVGDRLVGGGDRPSPQLHPTALTTVPASAPPPNPKVNPQPYSQRALDYFETIAFGSEFSQNSPVRRIRKWTRNLSISVQGQWTEQDRQTLNRIVRELNALVDSDGIRLDITNAGSNTSSNTNSSITPNVVIRFAPHGQFANYEPSYVPGNLGFFYSWWNGDMELVRSRILISSDRISQEERNHLIREELTQSLGLMNDAWTYQDSTFYQGWTRTQNYSDIDRDLVRILYDPRVKPGQTPAQVRQALQ